MGIVYRALDRLTGEPVALKMLEGASRTRPPASSARAACWRELGHPAHRALRRARRHLRTALLPRDGVARRRGSAPPPAPRPPVGGRGVTLCRRVAEALALRARARRRPPRRQAVQHLPRRRRRRAREDPRLRHRAPPRVRGGGDQHRLAPGHARLHVARAGARAPRRRRARRRVRARLRALRVPERAAALPRRGPDGADRQDPPRGAAPLRRARPRRAAGARRRSSRECSPRTGARARPTAPRSAPRSRRSPTSSPRARRRSRRRRAHRRASGAWSAWCWRGARRPRVWSRRRRRSAATSSRSSTGRWW